MSLSVSVYLCVCVCLCFCLCLSISHSFFVCLKVSLSVSLSLLSLSLSLSLFPFPNVSLLARSFTPSLILSFSFQPYCLTGFRGACSRQCKTRKLSANGLSERARSILMGMRRRSRQYDRSGWGCPFCRGGSYVSVHTTKHITDST